METTTLGVLIVLALITLTSSVTPPTTDNDIPFIECPYDSVAVAGGKCVCKPTLSCNKPHCAYTLSVAVEADRQTPGRCCPKYRCDGCPEEERVDGRCPCAPNATLNDAGDACECDNPHETLAENGTCVCDPNKCELPQLCDGRSVETKEVDGCCTRTKCITCPDDSYVMGYKSDQIEPKCVCYECKREHTCSPDKRPVVVQRGRGFPGRCCDLYDCEPLTERTCTVANATYGEGDTWDSPDGACTCRNGIAMCTHSADVVSNSPCFTDEGKVYAHQESWLEDRCTNCTCNNGDRRCIAHLCDEGNVKKDDCEPLVDCNKSCPHGFRVNKKGCEICKCAKVDPLDEILYKYKVTKDELIHILSDRVTERLTTTTTAAAATSSSSTTPTTIYIRDKCDGQDMAIPWYYYIVVFVLVGGLSAGIIIGLVKCLYCHRKQGKTSFPMVTPYSYSPVKAKLENNNNARIFSVNEKSSPEKYRLT